MIKEVEVPNWFNTSGYAESGAKYNIIVGKIPAIKDGRDTRFDIAMELADIFTEEILNYVENKMQEDIGNDRNEDGILNLDAKNKNIESFNKKHLDSLLKDIKDVMLQLRYTDGDKDTRLLYGE